MRWLISGYAKILDVVCGSSGPDTLLYQLSPLWEWEPSEKGKGQKLKAVPTLAVLSKWVFNLESMLTGRFPGQPDVEDVKDAEIFPFECANSKSCYLPTFLSLHSFQLKSPKIPGIKYFRKSYFFMVLTRHVCSST